MMSFVRISCLLLFASIVVTSCKQTVPAQAKLIPKDAVFVMSFNTKSLQEKLNKDTVVLQNFFASIGPANDTTIDNNRREWNNFKNSGIDLQQDFYIAAVKQPGAVMQAAGSGYFMAIAMLKDAAKFEAYVLSKNPKAEVKKDKEYSYILESDNILGWQKDKVIAMSSKQSKKAMMEYDSVNHSYNIKPGTANSSADLVSELATCFNLKEEESVASIEAYGKLLKEKADAAFWTNTAATADAMPVSFPRLKELTENSYTAATANFLDGKIVFDSKTYVSRALSELMKKYPGPDVNLSLVENYPSANIDAFAAASINPQLFDGIVNFLEVGAMANNYVGKMFGPAFTFSDVLKAFKGDFAFVVSDVRADSSKTRTTAVGRNSKMSVNIAVGDKNQMDRIMDNLSQKQFLQKNNNQYALPPMLRSFGFNLSVSDKNLLLGTDSNLLAQYQSGTGKATIDASVMNDFKNKSAILFVDLQKIMNAFPRNDSASINAANTGKETFKYIKAYAEKFNGNFIPGHWELKTVNDNENSLTSMLKFFTAASRMRKPGTLNINNMDSLLPDGMLPGKGL